jgi:hypothetical protein
MESLELIRFGNTISEDHIESVDWTKYKGAMSKQPLSEINQQLDELRSE